MEQTADSAAHHERLLTLEREMKETRLALATLTAVPGSLLMLEKQLDTMRQEGIADREQMLKELRDHMEEEERQRAGMWTKAAVVGGLLSPWIVVGSNWLLNR